MNSGTSITKRGFRTFKMGSCVVGGWQHEHQAADSDRRHVPASASGPWHCARLPSICVGVAAGHHRLCRKGVPHETMVLIDNCTHDSPPNAYIVTRHPTVGGHCTPGREGRLPELAVPYFSQSLFEGLNYFTITSSSGYSGKSAPCS